MISESRIHPYIALYNIELIISPKMTKIVATTATAVAASS